MSSLANIQSLIRTSVLDRGMVQDLEKIIVSDSLDAADRMQVYVNNYRESLVSALMSVFPVFTALASEPFARQAMAAFIYESPPERPALQAYGEDFSEFVKSYEPADGFPFFVDILRLEWAIHSLQFVRQETGTHVDGLYVNPCVRFVISDFPVLNLWMVGTGQLPPEAVSLDQGGQSVVIVLTNEGIRLFPVDDNEKQALVVLNEGKKVGEAMRSILLQKGLLIKGM